LFSPLHHPYLISSDFSLQSWQGLGTGVLFAARMRNKARGRWITKALKAMTSSNRVVSCENKKGYSKMRYISG
jgi:hypothetical protein